MSPGKIALAIGGALVALIAVGLMASGAGLLLAYETQRADDECFTSPRTELTTDAYAMTATEIDLGSQPGDWLASHWLATVRLTVESQGPAPVFMGVGPDAEVDTYLDGTEYAEITRIAPDWDDVTYRMVPGDAPSVSPAELDFWTASAQGVDTQSLTWEVEQGEWTVVIMNADASRGVTVEASAGARTLLLIPVVVILLAGGVVLAALAAILLVTAVRRPGIVPLAGATTTMAGSDGYPVRIEARLDPGLSRWQWLVKWLLAIPHYIVLVFLWVALAVLTVVAGFAIVFMGRYPRAVFNFNVGVLRWTWRVAYYSYAALGTDQYPPFTLADADYPASLDIAYPEQLSRGLVLVKWWLLAIPHYLIIGLFTSGLVWWSTELNEVGDPILRIGGGLIGILVLIAAVALAFTGRYPQGLFDVVMGLNRWIYRVLAYVALMRDEYPPFRLDTGGFEPGATPPSSSAGPTEGGDVPTEPDLSRV